MTKAQYLRPEQTIKRGKATYHHHQTFDTRPAADFAAHYVVKGTRRDTTVVREAITTPRTMLEKLVLGKVPVRHVYHVYVADGRRTGRRR